MMFQDFDLKTKKLLLLFLSCLFCWWLLVASATCSASAPEEPVYQITETELTTLENNLARLSAINSRLQTESKTQNTQATQLLEQLRLLQNQLTALRLESEKQRDLLTAANKSLAEYATEAKRERLRIKAQRNAYFTLMVAAAVAAVCHK